MIFDSGMDFDGAALAHLVQEDRLGRIDVTTDGPSAGRTALPRTGRPVRFGTGADTAVFERRFLVTLRNRR